MKQSPFHVAYAFIPDTSTRKAIDSLDALEKELVKAQRDATRPRRYELEPRP
ncbi:MAG: hypothetical protein H0T92_19940 [Pyrinomonadaceae bacterium]|nr:hypothetical protein [Pyrinomonadaceae bacterium]